MSKRRFKEKDIPEGLRAVFYHIRLQSRIVETVCNLVDEGSGSILAVGHSYVSSRDNPCKKIGRDISRGRALKIYSGLL